MFLRRWTFSLLQSYHNEYLNSNCGPELKCESSDLKIVKRNPNRSAKVGCASPTLFGGEIIKKFFTLPHAVFEPNDHRVNTPNWLIVCVLCFVDAAGFQFSMPIHRSLDDSLKH